MVKTLELAISKAAELPEATQEQLGRELLERIDGLSRLQEAVQLGLQELDQGKGVKLELKKFLRDVREHRDDD